MPSSTSPTILGLDVHKNTISAGILRPGHDVADVEKISSDDDAVRRLIARLGSPRRLRACYEAGPTGYELCRLLKSLGVACEVIAPSLIPTAPGDRVKTDKRDCRRLARLYRAGELVAIRVPTVAEEAVRDLCRARADMVIDRTRARHRLGKFLLRHNRIWRGGDNWTMKHQAWIAAQRFDDLALEATFAHYRATLSAREAAVEAIDADLACWYRRPPFADTVARLAAYRGSPISGALSLAAEVCDWRRFGSAGTFMAFTGLTPTEHSSAARASGAAISPMPATSICAPSWSSRPGPTGPDRPWGSSCAAAKPVSNVTPSLGPGPPKSVCAAGSGVSTNVRPTATSSSPPSPESWPGSCGPR